MLAASSGEAGGLEVAVGEGANPDVVPGGRDDEGLDAGEGFFVADGVVAGVGVAEGGAGAVAGDAGAGVVDVAGDMGNFDAGF